MAKQATLFSFFQKPSMEKLSDSNAKEDNINHGNVQQRVDETTTTVLDNDGSLLSYCNQTQDDKIEHEGALPNLFCTGYETKIEDNVISDDETSSTTFTTSVSNDKKTTDEYPLSEYEQLRLRNIQRNHDRLVALGLADPETFGSSLETKEKEQNKNRTNKRKTRIRTSDTPTNKVVRRSTRNKTVRLDDNHLTDTLISDATFTDDAQVSEETEVDVPLFTDSPLVQYTMTSERLNSHSSQHVGKISSLSVDKARFIPPKSNLAWYSIDVKTNGSTHLAVAAGKGGIISLWNHKPVSLEEDVTEIEPLLSWKGHNGRWIADAKFVTYKNIHSLLTASNDGCISLWDLNSVNAATGVPRCLATTGKHLHSSGIFSMDLNTKTHNTSNVLVATGSKDKTIAVTPLENIGLGSSCKPLYVSHYHSSKVGCVHMQGWESNLVGSASDDGSFAVHDIRSDATSLHNHCSHLKPHSFVWHPTKEYVFMTAGYDDSIHVWDMRYPKYSTFTCKGHVPNTVKKIKRIHRPTFLQTTSVDGTNDYILTGSENSHCLSIYECNYETAPENVLSVYSRGNLPNDCNDDVCCITSTADSSIYVSLSDGEVLLLHPN